MSMFLGNVLQLYPAQQNNVSKEQNKIKMFENMANAWGKYHHNQLSKYRKL
jgi:hypothetical protein